MANITLKQIFGKDDVQAKMNQLLGKKASGFITSVLQIASNNTYLANADPMTIYNAAMTAAALDLPINQNLGFAYIVPYGKAAQFQMGWKGYVQLAQRTGQYKSINVIEVYESQFVSFNTLTEELNADFSVEQDGEIVGYAAYFKLLNGFEKFDFWTTSKVEKHGKRFSKNFNSGPWKTDFDAMAKKTVLKSMLSKWGILSIEMQTANIADQAVIEDYETGAVRYVDNEDFDDVETKLSISDKDFNAIKAGILSGQYDLIDVQERYHFTEQQLAALYNE